MGKKQVQPLNYQKNIKINLQKSHKLTIIKTWGIYQPAITMANKAGMTAPSWICKSRSESAITTETSHGAGDGDEGTVAEEWQREPTPESWWPRLKVKMAPSYDLDLWFSKITSPYLTGRRRKCWKKRGASSQVAKEAKPGRIWGLKADIRVRGGSRAPRKWWAGRRARRDGATEHCFSVDDLRESTEGTRTANVPTTWKERPAEGKGTWLFHKSSLHQSD